MPQRASERVLIAGAGPTGPTRSSDTTSPPAAPHVDNGELVEAPWEHLMGGPPVGRRSCETAPSRRRSRAIPAARLDASDDAGGGGRRRWALHAQAVPEDLIAHASCVTRHDASGPTAQRPNGPTGQRPSGPTGPRASGRRRRRRSGSPAGSAKAPPRRWGNGRADGLSARFGGRAAAHLPGRLRAWRPSSYRQRDVPRETATADASDGLPSLSAARGR